MWARTLFARFRRRGTPKGTSRNLGEPVLRLALCGLAVVVATIGAVALAGTERYDYDALGRLVRVIDEQGRVTEYVYDPAGNILRVVVSGPGSAQPPSVTNVSPDSARRGETRSVVVTGTGLFGAQVSTTDPALSISALQTSGTQISFDLSVLADAVLGAKTLSIANAGGSASIQVTVNPLLPGLGLDPAPIALVTNGSARDFTVTFSNEDNIEHVISVTSGDTAIATVSPASLTFLPGETSKVVSITPLALGRTTLELAGAGLATVSIPLGVGPALLGEAVSMSRQLSVHLRAATPGAPAGNAMAVSRSVSVHLRSSTPGAPSGNTMSVSGAISVHLRSTTAGAPAGNSMSVTQPVSVSMP
jgi:YD repeat-containing protein